MGDEEEKLFLGTVTSLLDLLNPNGTTFKDINNGSEFRSRSDGGFVGKSFIIPLYAVIFFLSMSGNSLVIFTLARNRRMRTVTNVFLINLAVADLMLGVLCMPVTLVGQILRNFVFGHTMCKIIPYFQAVSVSVAVWTLVAISLERYFAICRPLKSRHWQTKSHAYKTIATIWVLTLGINTPIIIFSHLQPMQKTGTYKCREIWPTPQTEKGFNLILDLILLCVPLLIMGLAYSLIVSKLWKGLRNEMKHKRNMETSHQGSDENNSMDLSNPSGGSSHYSNHPTNEIVTIRGGKGVIVRWKKKQSIEVTEQPSCTLTNGVRRNHHGENLLKLGHNNLHLRKADNPTLDGNMKKSVKKRKKRAIRSNYTGKSIESKKKVIRMLFVLVAEFFVCWTPVHIINTLVLFHPQTLYKIIGPLSISLIHLLSYSSSCLNPITYAFMNRKFRQAFMKAVQELSLPRPKPQIPLDKIRGSELRFGSGNDSVFGPHGSTLNKSVVLECEGQV